MPDFALDYGVLHKAKDDLHSLADQIGPKLGESAFDQVGDQTWIEWDTDTPFGNVELGQAFGLLHTKVSYSMSKAESDIRQLGDLFGAVADAFFDVDAQIASGMGVMGSTMKLDEWRSKQKAWDYKQAHLSECTPKDGETAPGFCSAVDPGKPQLDYDVTTATGKVHTHLTLDDHYNVTQEESTITTNGQTYTSTTTYQSTTDYTTKTTFADNTTTTSAIHMNGDGTGTMSVTDNAGAVTTYHKTGPGAEWLPDKPPPDESDDGGAAAFVPI